MIIKENGGGGGFKREPIKAGMHVARCYMLVDLGTHIGSAQYGSKEQRKVQLAWEIVGQRVEYEFEGQQVNKPAAVYARYTQSLHEKSTLRSVLKSWRGRDFTAEELEGFDMKNILGAPCLINITHTPKDDGSGDVWENVSSVTPLMDGQEAPPAENEKIYYSIDEMGWSIPESVYPWIVDKFIKESLEYKLAHGGQPQYTPEQQAELDKPVPNPADESCPF